MAPIKILLITPLLLLFVLLAARGRSRALSRLVFMGIAATGVLLVAFPEWTMLAAGWVGVGRGADLVFYVAMVASFFAHVATVARLRRLEAAHTELVRERALSSAVQLGSAPDRAREEEGRAG